MTYLVVFVVIVAAILMTLAVDRLIEREEKQRTSGSRRGGDLI